MPHGRKRWRFTIIALLSLTWWPARAASQMPDAAALIGALGCAGCHAGMPARTSTAPPLGPTGARYDEAWLFDYMAHGSAPRGGSPARMPDFRLDDAERVALAAFVASTGTGSLRAPATDAQKIAHRSAQAASRNADAGLGRRIFTGLNCAGCHVHQSISAWSAGPDLSREGSRVQTAWLSAYLARPHAVRPYGAYPGTGSRMPDFRLTSSEIATIASYLSGRRVALPSFTPRALSPFAEDKATALLRDELSCLGCHRIANDGGKIGPDLSNAGSRLQPAWVAAMIRDPRHTVPSTIMPRVPMLATTQELITSYIATRRSSALPPASLSLAQHDVLVPRYGDGAADAYSRTCSHCHGASGKGDGWNARYLPVRPTAHADNGYMSTRADGTLLDGIHGGGRILNRSNRMPPFGESFTHAQLRELVGYLRVLCDCTGPSWSRPPAGASR